MFAKAVALAAIVTTTFAGTLGPIHTRSLLPNVTIKALPAGCASYPGYNADANTAGPWSLTVSDSEKPELNNFGPSSAYSLAVSRQGPVMRWGYITLNDRADIARTAFRCSSDKLEALVDTSVNAAGAPGNAKFTPLALSPYPYDASLLYLRDGEQPSVFKHYIGDEEQPGWYLGGYNTTTWGAKWYEAETTSYFLPYFYLRLLPAGQGLDVNETRVFLKFQA